jgi:hypothetical protein
MPFKTLNLITLVLGLSACSAPTSHPFDERPPEVTPAAGRLRVVSRLATPKAVAAEGLRGMMEARLRVEPDGTVSRADLVRGPSQLWGPYHPSVLKLKFAAAQPGETGPWEVLLAIMVRPPAREAVTESTMVRPSSPYASTGSAISSRTLTPGGGSTLYIVDVSSIPAPPGDPDPARGSARPTDREPT